MLIKMRYRIFKFVAAPRITEAYDITVIHCQRIFADRITRPRTNIIDTVLDIELFIQLSRFGSHFRCFFDHVFNAADHVEGLLWNIVILPFQNAFKAGDGVFQ